MYFVLKNVSLKRRDFNMSEEIKTIEEKKCNCICQSEYFKKFSCIALGTFVGGFCALNLFAALHKPPMMPMMPMGGMHKPHQQIMMHKGFAHKHHPGCNCSKKMMMKKHFEKRADFAKQMEEKLEDKK